MSNKVAGKRFAVLVEDGFEEAELQQPVDTLRREGGKITIISPQSGSVMSWDKTGWGPEYNVDLNVGSADVEDFDALILPGGVMNPDKLRVNEEAVNFVRKFMQSGKVVAAICHGPWTLIETGLIKGRHLTSWPSLQTDLINAGAIWADEEVVTDNGLITSRKPADIPAFVDKIMEEVNEVQHQAV